MGRFINADNVSVVAAELGNLYNKNLYSYTDNNPINRIDVYGEFWIEIGALISANPVAIAVVAVVAVAFMTSPQMRENMAALVTSLVVGASDALSIPSGNSTRSNAKTSIGSTTSLAMPNYLKKGLSDVGKKFGYGFCFEAAAAMQKYLQKNNQSGALVFLTFSGEMKLNNIWSLSKNKLVGTNGVHMGVLFDGNIYCNIHPLGLPQQAWINDFIGFGTKSVAYKYF